jgi:dihydrofolate reductase
MNSLPKVVCSRTLQTAGWNNATVVKDAREVTSLKQQGSGNMFVFGSAILSKNLMKERLFDEYRIPIPSYFCTEADYESDERFLLDKPLLSYVVQ